MFYLVSTTICFLEHFYSVCIPVLIPVLIFQILRQWRSLPSVRLVFVCCYVCTTFMRCHLHLSMCHVLYSVCCYMSVTLYRQTVNIHRLKFFVRKYCFVWRHYFIWQLSLITSHRFAQVTKLRPVMNNVFFWCGASASWRKQSTASSANMVLEHLIPL